MTRPVDQIPQAAGASAAPPSARRAVLAAGLGSMLEHYDLSIYGFLAVVMASVFFPATDQATALLVTFATFGIAFISRPIGAIVIGEYADRAGRKKALSASLLLMGLGSVLLAAMPTYEDVGILASIGVIVARLIQGFSAGGEGATSPIFLAEQNPERRAFYPSLLIAFGNGTKVVSAGVGALLATLFTEQQMHDWAWRLPFLLGTLIIPIGLYVRSRVPETTEFTSAQTARKDTATRSTSSTAELFRHHKMLLLAQFSVNAQGATTFYFNLFLPTYAVTVLSIPLKDAFWPSIVMGALSVFIAPYAGLLADRIGRFRVMIVSSVAAALLHIPLYLWVLEHRTLGALVAVQIVGSVVTTLYNGSHVGMEADIFPTRTRATAAGLASASAKMLFGGFSLMIFQGLLTVTGDPISPLYFVVFAATISAMSTALLRLNGYLR